MQTASASDMEPQNTLKGYHIVNNIITFVVSCGPRTMQGRDISQSGESQKLISSSGAAGAQTAGRLWFSVGSLHVETPSFSESVCLCCFVISELIFVKHCSGLLEAERLKSQLRFNK